MIKKGNTLKLWAVTCQGPSRTFASVRARKKICRAPLEKKYGPHKSAVSVTSISFSRDSTVSVLSVKFVIGPVLRFLYRPYVLFFNPPPLAPKFYPPPADNAGLCPDEGLCRPSCCSPFVDQALGPRTHKGGVKTNIIVMDSGPVLKKVSKILFVAPSGQSIHIQDFQSHFATSTKMISAWPLSDPLRLRVQSWSRTRLRIAASIAFLFRACFKGVWDTIAPLSRGWAP